MNERNFDNFDEFADDYRNIHNKSIKLSGADSDYFSKYKIVELKKLLQGSEIHDILDFGCGDGNSVVYMRESFPIAKISGIDVSESSIAVAIERDIKNVDFRPFDGKIIPYPDDHFEIVFSSMVFHHIAHELHQEIGEEVYRVLKPGGKFVMFEHNPLNPMTRKVVRECPFDEDAILLKPSYSRQFFQKIGLKDVNISYTIFFPRIKIFNFLVRLESMLKKVFMGAQYYVVGVKAKK